MSTKLYKAVRFSDSTQVPETSFVNKQIAGWQQRLEVRSLYMCIYREQSKKKKKHQKKTALDRHKHRLSAV